MPAPSIFEFADKFGLESPFEPTAPATFPFATSSIVSDRTDYLPIVRINYDYEPLRALIAPAGTPGFITKVPLDRSFDATNRIYQAPAIVIATNNPALLPLRIELGFDPIGLQDNDGILTFTCTNGSVKLRFLDQDDPADVEKGTAKYDLRRTFIGDEFVLEISHSLPRGTRFEIDITATDNRATLDSYSSKRTRCGKLYLKVLERDVFFIEDVALAQDEMDYLAKFIYKIPKAKRLPEYRTNYCMQGTERSLSEMLHNRKDFYSVDRNHKRRSHVNLTDLTGADRAKVFVRLGYLNPMFEFDGYKINFDKLYTMVDDPEGGYNENAYDVIELSNARLLENYIKTTALVRLGWHIYYVTLSDNYHTLLLFIDNTNPKAPQYAFWDDDGGLTRSFGPVEEITEGFRHQTSWLFASNFLSMGHRKGHWPKHITRLWKVQRI